MGSRSKFGRRRRLKRSDSKPPVRQALNTVSGADIAASPVVHSPFITLGGDYVDGLVAPSAIDLLGDLAVSEEERKLRVQRREMPRFQLHTFDMVADPPDPNCRMLPTTTTTMVPDPQLGPPQP